MNTENNNSANVLIAEFMQVEVQDEVYFILPQFPYCNQLTDYNTYNSYKKETLEYHKNWNWLMEVVEKIESHGFTFEIKKNWACIVRKGENIILRWEQDKTKIEAVYNACLEFIKWYNQNK